jgi:hypothetical protein
MRLGCGRYATILVLAVADLPSPSTDPRITFVAFLYSLASSAAVHFGDVPDPVTGEVRPPNMEQASHVIEVLALLDQKTKGNLSAEERQFLEHLLYELRMRFVAAKGSGQ